MFNIYLKDIGKVYNMEFGDSFCTENKWNWKCVIFPEFDETSIKQLLLNLGQLFMLFHNQNG